jgi:hypothetical protein
VATHNDVAHIALALPETVDDSAGDHIAFSVRNGAKRKGIAWVWNERVDPKKPRVPNPGVMAIRVLNRTEKEALLASDPDKFFTEPHYDGFPAVLVRLAAVEVDELEELLLDAWRSQAPRALVKEYDRNNQTH